ncbi:hatching enzyme 1.2-like [Ornithodoros turicata]|uniref:hatching enzyme 1.2-like n=1 Tax=Ornithodoros turicata TaxID=34597 RepID=UPI00313904FF
MAASARGLAYGLWAAVFLIVTHAVHKTQPAPIDKAAALYSGKYDIPDVVEGDIYMPPITSLTDLRARTKDTPIWNNGIVYYVVDDAFDSWEKEEILSAMQQIEAVSCVRFKERGDEEGFIHILSKQGCFSEVGMSGLRQLVSLNFEVCATYGTIVHELLHVLGLWHEQSRADRDRYVRVVWNNVVPRFKANFMKTNRVPYLDEEYDYESIMHYFFNAFSKDPEQATLVPKNRGVELFNLGLAFKENRMTKIDIRKLNGIYKCPTGHLGQAVQE